MSTKPQDTREEMTQVKKGKPTKKVRRAFSLSRFVKPGHHEKRNSQYQSMSIRRSSSKRAQITIEEELDNKVSYCYMKI